jgi:cysteine desulfuration protein SufE
MYYNKNELNQLFEDFKMLEGWQDKYETLIEMGKILPELTEIKQPENLVSGCSSKVWVIVELKDGLVNLKINSNSLTVSGLMSIFLLYLDQKTPKEVLDFNLEKINNSSLQNYLSSNRQNGLIATLKRIKNEILLKNI